MDEKTRREFLADLGKATAVTAGAPILLLDGLTLPKCSEITLGPHWTRTLQLRAEHDFERMCDKYILACRYAPMKDWKSSRILFRKHALGFYLPEGTPTPGLNALCLLLRGMQNAF